MTACLPMQEPCLRDTNRNDFLSYRQWYGILTPEHEHNIFLGDIGRFSKEGDFLKLGSMFESSPKRLMEKGQSAEKWVCVKRPGPDKVFSSEEMMLDPFISSTTGWMKVPDESIREYISKNCATNHRIKFLCLRRADRSSLTYEYVKPTTAMKLGQLRKGKWAHALLLGGPLQRHELRHPGLTEWLNLNCGALRRQLELLNPSEQDAEYGIILVMTTYTSPGFTDVRFLNQGDDLSPIIMGGMPGANGASKWLRGYPVDMTQPSFNGEFYTNEAQGVHDVCYGTNCRLKGVGLFSLMGIQSKELQDYDDLWNLLTTFYEMKKKRMLGIGRNTLRSRRYQRCKNVKHSWSYCYLCLQCNIINRRSFICMFLKSESDVSRNALFQYGEMRHIS